MNQTRAQITECCKRLRLRRITDHLDLVEETDPELFLLKLLEMEVTHRDHSRVTRSIKNAGFYSVKTFDDYRFEDITLPSGITPEGIKKLTFLDDRHNLILYGNVGTGKTHLATAIGSKHANGDSKWRSIGPPCW